MDRAEMIAALVTDKFSGFKDGDESLLESASDARLEEFRAASEQRRATASATTRLESDHRNVTARLKVAEDRLKAGEAEMTEEEFIAKAPPSIKTLIETYKAEEAQIRASLVSQLKDLGANTEEELKKKPLEELKTLAHYARVSVPDFSGRGMPSHRAAEENAHSYAPPRGYDADIKRLQGRSH